MPTSQHELPLDGLDDRDSLGLDDKHAPDLRNLRTHRERVDGGPGAVLFSDTPTPGSTTGEAANVGTFTAQTSSGTQTISHGLGVTPQAIILWTSGQTVDEAVKSGYIWGYGFSDGTTDRSIAEASQSGASPPNTARRYAAKLLTLINAAGSTVQGECGWSAWTSTTFTVNWTTAPTAAYIISYMVIGASSGVAATVSEWTLTTGAGTVANTDHSTTPQIALHISADMSAAGNEAAGCVSLGVATGADKEWTVAHFTNETWGNSGSVAHYASSSLCAASGSGLSWRFKHTSFDANGFTITKQTPPSASTLVATLMISGLAGAYAGNFTASTNSAPDRQTVTGVGFRPLGGQIMAVFSNMTTGGVAEDGGVISHDQDLTIGGWDPSTHTVQMIFMDKQAMPVQCGGSVSTAELVTQHLGGGGPLELVWRRVGRMFSRDSGGFKIQWSKTAVNSEEPMFFWAIATSSSAIDAVGTPRNFAQPQFAGTQKNLLFTDRDVFNYNQNLVTGPQFVPLNEGYAAAASLRWGIANTQDICVWTRLGVNLRSYDGTSVIAHVTAGTDHSAKMLLAFNDRVVSVYTQESATNYPTRIRWPKATDITDYATTAGLGGGLLEVVETSNDPLTGGFVLGERAYLTKANEIIELIATGVISPVFRQETRIFGTGMIGTHSYARAEFQCFFLGPDEVYAFDGSSIRPTGSRIYKTLLSLFDYSTVADVAQGAINPADSEYWLLIPPYAFIYDYKRDRWFREDYADVQAIGYYRVGDTLNIDVNQSGFIVFGMGDARVGRSDPTAPAFFGDPIDKYFVTKDYSAAELQVVRGAPTAVPGLDRLNAVYAVRFRSLPSITLEVGYSIDGGTNWTTQDVTTNSFGIGTAWVRRAYQAIRFRFRLYDATATYQVRDKLEFDWQQVGKQRPST